MYANSLAHEADYDLGSGWNHRSWRGRLFAGETISDHLDGEARASSLFDHSPQRLARERGYGYAARRIHDYCTIRHGLRARWHRRGHRRSQSTRICL